MIKPNRIKHSKFKNSGILFELLVKQVTSDILKGKTESTAKDILTKYFGESSCIGKELKLYQFILNEKVKSSDYANRLLSTVLDARKKINEIQLLKEKYSLVNDIKNTYDLNIFFKGNINDYKVLASIYKLFEGLRIQSQSIDICKELYQSKNTIVEHIVSKSTMKLIKETDADVETYKKQKYDERILTYKILVDSFNKKYGTFLSEEQKQLLREYINLSDTCDLKVYIEKQIPVLIKKLKDMSPKITSDVIKIKINEVTSQLNTLRVGMSIKDSHMSTLLMGYQLLDELKREF